MKYEQEHLAAHDGTRLFLRAAAVTGKVKAHAVLTHGRGEYSGRYGHVAEALAERGLRLWIYDLRGHGRSGGRRGDVPTYDALLDDLDVVVQRARDPGAPLFLLGHSLGGQITLNYLLKRQPECRGAVIGAPYLRLAFKPKRWRRALARAALWLYPSFTQPTPLLWSRLSRDQAHLASFPDLELMHHLISARMYEAVRRGAIDALAGAPKLRVPLLLIHGADDAVTSVEATREFYEHAGSTDKTLRIYPDMLHEPHNEIGRERVIADVIHWIEERCAGPRLD